MFNKLFILSHDFEVRFVASYIVQRRDILDCKFCFLNASPVEDTTYKTLYGSMYCGSITFLESSKGIGARLRRLLELLRELTPSYVGNITVENFQRRFIDSIRQGGSRLRLAFLQILLILNRIRVIQKGAVLFERLLLPATPFTEDGLHLIRSFSEAIVGGVAGFRTPVRVANYLQREGIRVSAVSISWDNISGYGLPGFEPSLLYVWGDYNKRQAVRAYRIPEERVILIGACHLRGLSEKKMSPIVTHVRGTKLSVTIFGKSPKRFRVHAELLTEMASIFLQEGRNFGTVRFRPHPLMYRKCKTTGSYLFLDQIKEVERTCRQSGIHYCPPRMDSKGNAYFDHSVNDLLRDTDLALSLYSSVMIDSALMGIPHINLIVDYRKTGETLLGLGYETLFDRKQEHVMDFVSGVNSIEMSPADLTQAIRSPGNLLSIASRYNKDKLASFLGFGFD